MTMTSTMTAPIEAELTLGLSVGWNKVPGIEVDGRSVRITPPEFFFEFTDPHWLTCSWSRVRDELISSRESTELTYEQRVLEFVRTHGRTTEAGGDVLRVAEDVYSFLFREDHLRDPGVAALGVEAFHLNALREMGTVMALNRVELDGRLAVV